MDVIVFSPADGPRLRYTLDVVLRRLLGLKWWLTTEAEPYLSATGVARLNYGERALAADEVWIAPQGLLSAGGLDCPRPEAVWRDDLPVFFPVEPPADWSFDLLACCFYCLSRYEEYQPFTADRHGRFPASAGLARQHGFLERPVVQQWARILGERLRQRFPNLTLQPPAYHFLPTYDVDLAWAYRHRGLRGWAGAAANVLRGEWERLQERIAVLRGRRQDPYDTFARLDDWHERYGLAPLYFLLLADPGRYDPNSPPTQPAMRQLVSELGRKYELGIHPSYYTSERPNKLAVEIARLEKLTGKPVYRSRQHFLRLTFPRTYRQLLAAGIREDYSLGFADAPGFRAGMAAPFPWYDLERETTTELMIYPLSVMDVTLRQYLALTPAAALSRLTMLEQTVRDYGGHFITLWHNSSFADNYGWAGWAVMYENFLKKL